MPYKALSLIPALLLTSAVTPAAQAQDKAEFYIGGSLNWMLKNRSYLSDDLNLRLNDTTYDAQSVRREGLDFGLHGGMKYGDIKLELEYLNINFNAKSLLVNNPALASTLSGINAGSNRITGSFGHDAFMANAWYTVFEQDRFNFNIGAGLGRSKMSFSDYSTSADFFIDSSRWTTAYQLMAEVGYELSDNLEVALGYRHFKARKDQFQTTAGDPFFANNRHQSIMTKLTYKFGSAKKVKQPEPVAAPKPKAEPKPAIAKVDNKPVETKPLKPAAPAKPSLPATQEFIVFFDFDKSDISATAQAILVQAKQAFDNNKFIKIKATGHTDSRGTNPYNDRLSLQRVRAVQQALVKLGITADKIAIEAKGESQLLVKTGDNVKEPQNRRVEITLMR